MAEFDAFAPNYDAGMDNPLKRLVGESADDFMALKVSWLLENLRRAGLVGERQSDDNLELLDYGCGAGLLLRHLRRAQFPGRLRGCDVSAAMLTEACK